MAKLIVAVSALVLAASAQAAAWRGLRIDGSSEASFKASVALLQEHLPWIKGRMFEMSLQDIWRQGSKRAEAEQRQYTAREYFQQLDGLGYKDVLQLDDPTGEKTKERYRQARALYAEVLAAQRQPRLAVPVSGFSSTTRQSGFTRETMNINNQGYPAIWPANHP